MQHWTSAGGIIYWRDPETKEVWIPLLLDWKKRWTIPKGRIEKGETLAQCAMREVREELSIVSPLRIICKLQIQHLFYRVPKDPEIQSKRVHVYLMEITNKDELKWQAEEFYTGAQWFRFEDAAKLAYRQRQAFTVAKPHIFPAGRKRRRGRRGAAAPNAGTPAPNTEPAAL